MNRLAGSNPAPSAIYPFAVVHNHSQHGRFPGFPVLVRRRSPLSTLRGWVNKWVRAVARTIGKLTALAITQVKRRGYYGDGGGLFLQVSATGAKSWVFRFKEDRRLREMGLGPTHTVSLAEARQKALECRKARLDGLDPIEARRDKRIPGEARRSQGDDVRCLRRALHRLA
jgi:hypothetical protein